MTGQTTPAPGATPAPPGAQNGKAPVLRPFRGGTQPVDKSTGFKQTVTLGSDSQDLDEYQIAPSNILRCIWLEVTLTGDNSGSATVAFTADGALAALSTVEFADSGGTSIVGPFSSYTLAMAMKWFGFEPNGDVRAQAVYSATAGTGSTAGSANYVLRIPVEAVSRTGIAALQNQTTNSPFNLNITVATAATVYSTAPASATCTVKVTLGGYWSASDRSTGFSPTPRAFGTTQYINRATVPGLSGSSEFQVPNIGMGNPWRNVMMINRVSGARSGSDFPDPITIKYRGNTLYNRSQNLWKYEMSTLYSMESQTADAANGIDTGVFVVPFNRDFGLEPGAEMGLGYLITAIGDECQLIGSWSSSSSTLEWIVNYLAVKGAVAMVQGA